MSTGVRFLVHPGPPGTAGVVALRERGTGVDILHERCAGMDISKRDAKVCVRTPSPRRRGSITTAATTWGATTKAVLELREHLLAGNVTLVVMEATSDYWKPCYYLLSEGLNVILVNARQAKRHGG